MTRDELMYIAVATRDADGDTPEYRDAYRQRSFLEHIWGCYCDSLVHVVSRAMHLHLEWRAPEEQAGG